MKFEITKEQILSAYESKEKLKELFPEVFEKELEVGKWYISILGNLAFYENKQILCGFSGKTFMESIIYKHDIDNNDSWTEATEEEVFEALKNEAVRRGFKDGNYKCLNASYINTKTKNDYFLEDGKLWRGKKGCANCVFENGKWATIIETITKKEAEKLLNKKIID